MVFATAPRCRWNGRSAPPWPTLHLAVLLSSVVVSACVGPPDCTPGVAHRADVLLAFGEPVLALDEDRVLVHVWLRYTDARIPARGFYRSDRGGLRRIDVALPAASFGARGSAGTLSFGYVVHEFDEHGRLLRRLP